MRCEAWATWETCGKHGENVGHMWDTCGKSSREWSQKLGVHLLLQSLRVDLVLRSGPVLLGQLPQLQPELVGLFLTSALLFRSPPRLLKVGDFQKEPRFQG